MNIKFLRNVVLKGLILFLLLDLAFAAFNPAWLGKISLYNQLFPGRERFPFGEDSAQSLQPEPLRPGGDVRVPRDRSRAETGG